jgi:hypothetical protein
MPSLRLLAVFILLIAAPAGALACTCAPNESVSEALEDADAVFIGRVLQVTDGSGYSPLEMTLVAERAWKGIDAARVTAWTESTPGTCGRFLEPGKRYLIYAWRDAEYTMPGPGHGGLWVSLCSRTVLADHAAADLAQLGPGWVPLDETRARSISDLVVSLGAAGLLLAALVLGFLLRRRHTRPG